MRKEKAWGKKRRWQYTSSLLAYLRIKNVGCLIWGHFISCLLCLNPSRFYLDYFLYSLCGGTQQVLNNVFNTGPTITFSAQETQSNELPLEKLLSSISLFITPDPVGLARTFVSSQTVWACWSTPQQWPQKWRASIFSFLVQSHHLWRCLVRSEPGAPGKYRQV